MQYVKDDLEQGSPTPRPSLILGHSPFRTGPHKWWANTWARTAPLAWATCVLHLCKWRYVSKCTHLLLHGTIPSPPPLPPLGRKARKVEDHWSKIWVQTFGLSRLQWVKRNCPEKTYIFIVSYRAIFFIYTFFLTWARSSEGNAMASLPLQAEGNLQADFLMVIPCLWKNLPTNIWMAVVSK